MKTTDSKINDWERSASDSAFTPANDHTFCDNCQSNFACSRLYMSLKIAESGLFEMQKSGLNNVNVVEKLAAIKKKLFDQGWAYPHTSNSCKYATDIKGTWKELETVIDLIRSITYQQTSS